MAKELLAYRLNSIHNLFFYMRFMEDLRNAIRHREFEAFRHGFYERRLGDDDLAYSSVN